MKWRIRVGGLMLLVALAAVGMEVIRERWLVMTVQGEVNSPRKVIVTSGMTVVDALREAGNLTLPGSDVDVLLLRPERCGCHDQTLVVSLMAIVNLGDQTTNYAVRPGDRLVVSRLAWGMVEAPTLTK